jgi:filamentous hemagglutinin family protein
MSRPFTPSAIFPASSAVALSALVGATLPAPHALAQSITPATDGTGTQVAPNGSVYDITGGALSGDGANLFHSFQQFGLTPAEVANFIADPAVQNILGRVTGGDVSVIDGMLQVTGSDANLYLINPAGILFGPNAVLNLDGSFTATSASAVGFGENWLQAIGDADYARLNGDPTSLAFGDNAAALINSGNLAVDGGETLALVGGSVVNTGTLTAPGGQIVVMAVPGENLVRITPQGARLSLELATLPDAALPETSSGLTPLDIPSLLRAGGENVATGLTANEDGTVSLTGSERTLPTTPGSTIASGNIDASGPTGGTVYILGELVGVVDADVDAAGDAGGGTILVGGDYQGQGPVPNARRTYIDTDSTLAADAVETGDGGTVIAWADEATQFEGLITARGGSAAGDGGFVEVSGREVLAFNGLVDVSAAHGDWGTILLDPENITITGEPAVGTSPGVEATLPDIFADEFSSIVPSDISILNSVLASQTGNVILEATNDIQFEFSSFGISLNFVPGGSITFTADADNDGAGIFAMGALDSITTAGPRDITISGAAIELGTLDADGGNITLIGDAINLLGGPDSIRSTGNLSIRPVSSTTDIRLGLVEPSLGLLDLTASSLSALADGFSTITIGSSDITGNITLAEDVTFSGSFSTTLETGGSIDTSGHTLAGTGTTGLTLIAGNSITTSEVTTEGRGISIIGDADGDGDGSVEISGEIDSNGGVVSISGSSSSFGAGILTSSTFDSVTGAVISSGTISSGGGDISLFGTSNRFGDGVEIGHNLTSEGGDIFITGTSISNNGISIEANVNSQGGQIALDGDSTFSEGISLSAPITSGGGNITLTGSSTENVGFENDFQDNNLAGTIDSQGGDITIIGSSTGASSFDDGINLFAPITSRGGNVTLTGSSNGGAGIYSGFVNIPDGESIAVVDSQGGDITFTGISQSYIGILVVEDITSQGGDIAFTGDSQSNLGILLTENLNSSSGGNITLRTASSPISAQNLTTTGGNIDIQAGTTLTAVNLNGSNNSPGGDVTLEAPGGIRVNSINTQGSTTGGAIRVTTSGGFQALGSFAGSAGNSYIKHKVLIV